MDTEFEEVWMSVDCDSPVDANGFCIDHGQLAHEVYVIERPVTEEKGAARAV